MEAEKFKNHHKVEDFILDKKFIHWVISPNDELDSFWNSFISEYPQKETQIRKALLIVHSIQPVKQEVPQHNLDRILQTVKKLERRHKLTRYKYLKYAAVIAFLIGFSNLVYFSILKKNQFPIESFYEMSIKGKVILPDGSIKEFETEQTPITQTSSGNLIINCDTIDVKSNRNKTDLNQIIIPYGKRSDIRLADGTHVWLNSGSKLSYPFKFSENSREVYLSGEAFFEVKPNAKKPFFVNTHDIKIKVLGTSFNVCAYSNDKTVQTVLIKGRVTEGKNKLFASTIDLQPGERLTYIKSDKNLLKDKVDVKLYSSWVKGYLIFDNIPIHEVLTKLKRSYNQDIIIEKGLEQISFSGKLDLQDNIKDVLYNIAFASSLKVLKENGSYIIKE